MCVQPVDRVVQSQNKTFHRPFTNAGHDNTHCVMTGCTPQTDRLTCNHSNRTVEWVHRWRTLYHRRINNVIYVLKKNSCHVFTLLRVTGGLAERLASLGGMQEVLSSNPGDARCNGIICTYLPPFWVYPMYSFCAFSLFTYVLFKLRHWGKQTYSAYIIIFIHHDGGEQSEKERR